MAQLKGAKPGGGAAASRPLAVPGLAVLPSSLAQRFRTGRSPAEMGGLVARALKGGAPPPQLPPPPSAIEDGDERRTRPAAAAGAGPSRRLWQPPPLVKNLEPPLKDSPVLVRRRRGGPGRAPRRAAQALLPRGAGA